MRTEHEAVPGEAAAGEAVAGEAAAGESARVVVLRCGQRELCNRSKIAPGARAMAGAVSRSDTHQNDAHVMLRMIVGAVCLPDTRHIFRIPLCQRRTLEQFTRRVLRAQNCAPHMHRFAAHRMLGQFSRGACQGVTARMPLVARRLQAINLTQPNTKRNRP